MAVRLSMVEVHLKQLENCVNPPQQMRAGDAGADLSSAVDAVIEPGEWQAVPTGVAVAIPAGWCGLVLPRSGLALRSGITVMNSPGLIDSGYRGEIKAIVHNASSEAFQVKAGDRIAQLLVSPAPAVSFVVSDELPAATDDRGEAGFGSSGT